MSKHKQKENRNVILNHIKNNLKEYVSVIIVFLIGIVLGVIVLNNSNDLQKQELSTYVNDFVTQLNSDVSIDKIQLLKNVLINNLIIVIGLWFIGSTVIGIPIVYANSSIALSLIPFKSMQFGCSSNNSTSFEDKIFGAFFSIFGD